MKLSTIFKTFSIVVLFLIAVFFLEGSGRDLDYSKNFFNFIARLFPPDFSDIEIIFVSLIETIQIAFVAIVFASFISLFVSILSTPLSPTFFQTVSLWLLSLIRAIPSLLLAVIAVSIVGANSWAEVS